MEVFTLMLRRQVSKEKKLKYHWGCKKLSILNLCFVNDLMLFFHGDVISASIIKRALDEFCLVSGIFPVKYLGIPMDLNRISKSDCKVLLENVKKRIDDWRNKNLSFARRLQLIASVLNSLNAFWASIFILPQGTCKDVDKLLNVWTEVAESAFFRVSKKALLQTPILEFVLFTNHDSLRHIRTQDKVSHKHGRWLSFLKKFTFVVKHKTGISNRAADALSRRSNLLVSMQVDVTGLDVIREQLTLDPYFSIVLQGVQSKQKPDFNIHDGFLLKKNQLCIPDTSLRLKIIKELHGEEHVSRDRTLQFVQASYFWPTMRKEVDRYVKRCRICQFLKGTDTNAGLYMPLHVPVQPGVDINMDFVLGLPLSFPVSGLVPKKAAGFYWKGCMEGYKAVREILVLTKDRFPVGEYNKLSAKKIGPLEIVEFKRLPDRVSQLYLQSCLTERLKSRQNTNLASYLSQSYLMLTLEGFPFITVNTKEYHSKCSGHYHEDNA
ncbi:putative reverse transcriptase domain-containing protein [Tanacetum coccineum]|uniref:Reverse transcriptase domain-containing protein n=1 Tax=Tanacetum coccineum TaxID=301880 RepID=A0ABQ5APM1_9ASTR